MNVDFRGIATLSTALVRGSSWNDWKTKPIVSFRILASSSWSSPATSRPPTRSVPPDGRSRAPSRCMRVDLPEPDGPTTAR